METQSESNTLSISAPQRIFKIMLSMYGEKIHYTKTATKLAKKKIDRLAAEKHNYVVICKRIKDIQEKYKVRGSFIAEEIAELEQYKKALALN